MRLSELQQGAITPVYVTLESAHDRSSTAGLVGAPLQLSRPTPAATLLLTHAQQRWKLHGSTLADDDRLHAIVERGLPRVVRLTQPKSGADGRLAASLYIHEFQSEVLAAEPLELDVDERLAEKLRVSHRLGVRADLQSALKLLTEWFLFPDHGGPLHSAACITLGRGRELAAGEGFWLHGRALSASVRRTAEDRLLVGQVTPLRRELDPGEDPPRLLRGELSFVDATLASRLRPGAARELDALARSSGSYLARWDEVNEIERRLAVERARSLGVLRYERCTETVEGHWRFHLEPDYEPEAVRRFAENRREELAADEELPPELQDGWTDDGSAGVELPRRRFTGELFDADANEGYVELRAQRSRNAGDPPEAGFLFVSGLGDRMRLARRARARDAIGAATCPMPQLGLVLEGHPAPYARGRELAAVPPAVQRCFRSAPTPRQLEALRIAVNTPDIAVIQGPPGTGKTDVIAALERWLALLTGKRGGIAKSVLLTSYQHDAVDNAADRGRVLELPALRIGGRRGETDDGLPPDALAWGAALASELGEQLRTRGGDGHLLSAARKLQAIVLGYGRAPTTPGNTADELDKVAQLGEGLLSVDLRDRLRAHADALRQGRRAIGEDPELRVLRTAVRALRTTATAFADDGAINARRLLARLREHPGTRQADRELLARAAATATPDAELLGRLAGLRDWLLDELYGDRAPAGVATTDVTARRLLGEAAGEAGARVRNSRDSVGRVVEQLAHDLKSDPQAVARAVGHYTAIVAATCQQSASSTMIATAGVEFDTVIVDEAARANPLDLMIPLAQARRRIVLVGDHRQLPHMLEPEVERELGGDVAEETGRALRQSLFERLFEQFQREQRAGGPKRVVTLDTQFRMHPLLGDFVSRAFYEPHGTELHSVRPASEFKISLPGLPAPAAWVDLPSSSHGEERSVGSSRSRPAEAEWIAQRLAGLMEAEPQRTFGVISFYTAQVREIERALEQRELLVRDTEGELAPAPAWRELTDPLSGLPTTRLRIGTVDAFQGREFDVVLLSLTRAGPPSDSLDPLALRRRYGHLLLVNRLCVAMSRQRRMLVVVGDGELAVGRQARIAVPALVAFRELCEEVQDGAAALAVSA